MQTEKKFVPTFNVFLSEDLSKDAFIHWTDNVGKRHRRKSGINRFHTIEERRAAALALVKKLRAEYLSVLPITESMLAWVELHKGRWKRKTYETVKSRIQVFCSWLDGREISNPLMRLYFAEFASRRHGRTHNEHLHTFKRLFKWLGMPDVMDEIEMQKAISTPAKYFQQHQIAQIKKRLLEKDPSLWLACEMLYYCFIRPGEMRLLKVSDIHFDENKICVRSAISKNKKTQFVTIPVAFRTSVDALKYRSPNEFVFFRTDCTKPLSVNNLLNRFRRVLTALGFGTEYKLYSWKHTGAVACVRAGASLEELQIQLRHHSLEEVDKYIRQLGVNDLRDLEGRFPGI